MTKARSAGKYIFLIIASVISVFPLVWMAISATNTSVEVVAGKMTPGTYLVQNFQNLLTNQDVAGAMANSFKYSIVLTLLSLLICSLAGYGFEIFHDRAKDTVMSVLLLAMMVPLAAVVLWMGVYPKPFTDVMHVSVTELLKHVAISKLN